METIGNRDTPLTRIGREKGQLAVLTAGEA